MTRQTQQLETSMFVRSWGLALNSTSHDQLGSTQQRHPKLPAAAANLHMREVHMERTPSRWDSASKQFQTPQRSKTRCAKQAVSPSHGFNTSIVETFYRRFGQAVFACPSCKMSYSSQHLMSSRQRNDFINDALPFAVSIMMGFIVSFRSSQT